MAGLPLDRERVGLREQRHRGFELRARSQAAVRDGGGTSWVGRDGTGAPGGKRAILFKKEIRDHQAAPARVPPGASWGATALQSRGEAAPLRARRPGLLSSRETSQSGLLAPTAGDPTPPSFPSSLPERERPSRAGVTWPRGTWEAHGSSVSRVLSGRRALPEDDPYLGCHSRATWMTFKGDSGLRKWRRSGVRLLRAVR